jgi:hypothetical protein
VAVLDSILAMGQSNAAIVLVAPPASGSATGAAVFADGVPVGTVRLSPLAVLADPIADDTPHFLGDIDLENAGAEWTSFELDSEAWTSGAALLLVEKSGDFELLAVREFVVTGTDVECLDVIRGFGTEKLSHDAGARVWLVRFESTPVGEPTTNPAEFEPLRAIGETRTVPFDQFATGAVTITAAVFNVAAVSDPSSGVTYTYGFRAETPLPVTELSGFVSSGDAVLSWTPRSRVATFFDGSTQIGGAYPIRINSFPAPTRGRIDGDFIVEESGVELIRTTEFANVTIAGAGAGTFDVFAEAGGFRSAATSITIA